MTAVNPQTPTIGNLLLLGCALTRSSSAPTIVAPSGWTTIIAPTPVASGANWIGAFAFWRKADGTSGDLAPVLSGNWAATSQGVIEEWAGLDLTTGPDVTTTGATNVGASGTLSPSYTTTNASDWIWTFFSARSASGGTFTPDATYATSLAPIYNAPVNMSSYTRTLTATGTYNPGIGYASCVAAAATGAAFKISAPPAGSVVPQSMFFAG